MFRDGGVIMLNTSILQAISVDNDYQLCGRGKQNKLAHFRVHKVADTIRKFESLTIPKQFIRCKENKIDCMVSVHGLFSLGIAFLGIGTSTQYDTQYWYPMEKSTLSNKSSIVSYRLRSKNTCKIDLIGN